MRVQFNAIPPQARLQHLLAPYNIKIATRFGNICISRGSLSAIQKIRLYPQELNTSNPVIADIGPFCDFSECALILGGEHTTAPCQFTGAPQIAGVLKAKNILLTPSTKGPLIIGANSVFSFGSIVLSGTRIGENSLIAAGSIVGGEHLPNSIIAGVPGRKLKDRFKNIPNFWVLNDEYIGKLFSGELSEIQPEAYYKDYDKFFILAAEPDDMGKLGTLEWRGVEFSGRHIEVPDLPAQFKSYMSQLSQEKITTDDNLFQIFNHAIE